MLIRQEDKSTILGLGAAIGSLPWQVEFSSFLLIGISTGRTVF